MDLDLTKKSELCYVELCRENCSADEVMEVMQLEHSRKRFLSASPMLLDVRDHQYLVSFL